MRPWLSRRPAHLFSQICPRLHIVSILLRCLPSGHRLGSNTERHGPWASLSTCLHLTSRLRLRVHRLAYSRHRTSKFAPAPCLPPCLPDCRNEHRPWGAFGHPLPARLSPKLPMRPLGISNRSRRREPKLLASLLFWTPHTGQTPDRPGWSHEEWTFINCSIRSLRTLPPTAHENGVSADTGPDPPCASHRLRRRHSRSQPRKGQRLQHQVASTFSYDITCKPPRTRLGCLGSSQLIGDGTIHHWPAAGSSRPRGLRVVHCRWSGSRSLRSSS